MILVIAKVRIHPGKDPIMAEVAQTLAEASRREPGNVSYAAHRSAGDADLWVYVEEWASQGALDEHFRSPHFAAAGARFGELLAAPPDVTVYDVAGSRKLDLTA